MTPRQNGPSASGAAARRRPRSWSRLSIRGKILFGFLALGTITALLGYHGTKRIAESGGLIVDTYDKPLMSINYSQSILVTFTTLQAAVARWHMADTARAQQELAARIDALSADLAADLDVVGERTPSARTVQVLAQVRAAIATWQRIRAELMNQADEDSAWLKLDEAAADAKEQVDILINLAAGDGFLARKQALTTIENSHRLYIGATLAALALAAIVTVLLLRAIIHPVRAASAAAARIARGELDIPIPPAGTDELGSLLASMEIMRGNIQSMMAAEIAQRRNAQTRLTDAIENSPEGMILVDGGGEIVIANSQAADFLPGLKDQLVEGASFSDLVARTGAGGIMATASPDEITRRLLTDPMPSIGEQQLADGRWLRIGRSATQEGGLIAIFSDITVLKDRETALQTAKEKAEAGDRSKTQFLAAVSHELRTPLNAVIGFSEIIAMEYHGPIDPAYREYVGDIIASGRHLLSIINDILDISHGDSGKLRITPEAIMVADLFEECRRVVHEQCASADLTLELALSEPALQIRADPLRARQILLNLLGNAIKFTPAGGRITLSAEATGDGFVALAVADTGIGMDSADIPIALQPFGQVDAGLARKYTGTGLGLPLAKSLAELHGGTLTVESSLGKGTVVFVRLPASDRQSSRAA